MIHKWLKLLPHHHTGKMRPHEHTSYAPLAFILMVALIPLLEYTAFAADHPEPQMGSVGISGVMPAKPPTIAATITSPGSGQHFSATPVIVKGTCLKSTLVEIFKNDIFAGSSACTDTGSYSVDIDLLYGSNTLIARVYDSLNQPGPDSNSVVVYYDLLPEQAGPLASLDFARTQLLLNTDAVFRGVFPDKEMSLPLEVIGGTPPYALNFVWGDSTNKMVARNDNIGFNMGHIYKKPGVYQITIQGTDAMGRVAFLTVAAVVNGQSEIIKPAETTSSSVNPLFVLWPLYVGIAGSLLSFWLGEVREKRVLKKRGQLLPA